MPALPKPSDARRNRGPGDHVLPLEGRQEPAPAMPAGDWSADTKVWWERVWRSPMAVMWLDADFDAVVRLARVREEIAKDAGKASLHAAASQLEDRLGLSPRARRALGWRIGAAAPADQPVVRVRRIHAL